MFQNGQKVVVVSSGDPARVIKVQSASGTPDPSRYPIVDTTGVSGRDQSVQIVSGGDPTRFPILRGVSDARGTADSVISALTPAAWYRNATGVTSAGGFASQWDDYSGNARHLKQTTGTNQPAYAAGVFTFDGADNYMSATYARASGRTVYWVGKQVTWTNFDFVYCGTAENSMTLYQDTTTPNLNIYAGTNDAASRNGGAALNTVVIACSVFNGASSSLRINNNAKTSGSIGITASSGFRLGASNVPNAYWNGTALEVIDFAAAHSDAEQDSVITALANALSVSV